MSNGRLSRVDFPEPIRIKTRRSEQIELMNSTIFSKALVMVNCTLARASQNLVIKESYQAFNEAVQYTLS